ncbi:MAG: hypothetical protein HQL69_13300 [Magnetococcales bacterium]|nr:hypothetical protein [Magnetococcales bacterium]
MDNLFRWRTVFVLPLIIVMSGLLFIAKDILISDLHLIVADRDINSWQNKGGVKFSKQQWESVEINLQNALSLDPNNPKILLKLSAHHDRLAQSMRKSGWRKRRSLRKAVDYLRMAIINRPVSPMGWGGLVLAKHQLKAVDQEFWNAVNQAVYLGPWEQRYSVAISKIAIKLCNSMPRSIHGNVEQYIKNGVMENSDELVGFLNNHNQKCQFDIPIEKG